MHMSINKNSCMLALTLGLLCLQSHKLVPKPGKGFRNMLMQSQRSYWPYPLFCYSTSNLSLPYQEDTQGWFRDIPGDAWGDCLRMWLAKEWVGWIWIHAFLLEILHSCQNNHAHAGRSIPQGHHWRFFSLVLEEVGRPVTFTLTDTAWGFTQTNRKGHQTDGAGAVISWLSTCISREGLESPFIQWPKQSIWPRTTSPRELQIPTHPEKTTACTRPKKKKRTLGPQWSLGKFTFSTQLLWEGPMFVQLPAKWVGRGK